MRSPLLCLVLLATGAGCSAAADSVGTPGTNDVAENGSATVTPKTDSTAASESRLLGSPSAVNAPGAPNTASTAIVHPFDDNPLENALPPDVKTVASWASALSSAFTGGVQAFQVAQTVLQWLGVLQQSPDETKQLFDQLSAHLDLVAGSLSWQQGELARETWIQSSIADLETAKETLTLHQPLAVDSPPATDLAEQVSNAEADVAFLRYYDSNATNGNWKWTIFDQPQVNNGFVYDWRLGVPALMQLIGLRMQMIAAVDPNFLNDGAFNDELMGHRSVLLKHKNNMLAGIRCNILPNLYNQTTGQYCGVLGGNECSGGLDAPGQLTVKYMVACADINTGLAQTSEVDATLLVAANMVCANGQCMPVNGTDYNNWYASTLQPVQDRLYRKVRYAMPFFDMQAMIDSLYYMAHHNTYAYDLTTWAGQIPTGKNWSLCLNVTGASPNWGTPLQLWPCTSGDPASAWKYDRKAETITATSYNLCLDVPNGDPTPGTHVQTWACNGADAQRWTYNPEDETIMNAAGNQLDIPYGNVAQGQAVWTWPFSNFPAAQQWYGGPILYFHL